MKFKELPLWLKLGTIFFSVSLLFYILIFICASISRGDAGFGCIIFLGPLIPYFIIFDVWGFAGSLPGWLTAFFGVIINGGIGMLLGLIITRIKELK